VQSIMDKTGAELKEGDMARLDPGLIVVMTYLQDAGLSRNDVFRCVEYVTEFDFKHVRSACFWGAVPGREAPDGLGAQ